MFTFEKRHKYKYAVWQENIFMGYMVQPRENEWIFLPNINLDQLKKEFSLMLLKQGVAIGTAEKEIREL